MSVTNSQKDYFSTKLNKKKDELPEPFAGVGLLSTDDRVSEILTGIIMILTYTCTISVIKSDNSSVIDLLAAGISSTAAWGFIDAVMYLFMTMIERSHNLTFLNFVQKSKDSAKISQSIRDELPEVISKLMLPDEIEKLREKLQKLPELPKIHRLKFSDYKKAGEIFLLVFFATIPVSVPFIIINDLNIAIRVSNIIAIVMMFFCGRALGKFAGRNRFLLGIKTSLIGIVLVAGTMALGG
jgi:hypothetical protein